MSATQVTAKLAQRLSAAQWLWTFALVAFILAAHYGNLDWSPVLIPSAVLIWYGTMRGGHNRPAQE